MDESQQLIRILHDFSVFYALRISLLCFSPWKLLYRTFLPCFGEGFSPMASTVTKSERPTGILQDVSAKSKTAATRTRSPGSALTSVKHTPRTHACMHARILARTHIRDSVLIENYACHTRSSDSLAFTIALSSTHKLSKTVRTVSFKQCVLSTKMSKHKIQE